MFAIAGKFAGFARKRASSAVRLTTTQLEPPRMEIVDTSDSFNPSVGQLERLTRVCRAMITAREIDRTERELVRQGLRFFNRPERDMRLRRRWRVICFLRTGYIFIIETNPWESLEGATSASSFAVCWHVEHLVLRGVNTKRISRRLR